LIKGIHGLYYSSKPEETRAFIRDKLQLPYNDVGDGWLIFDFKEGDLGVHPTENETVISGKHEISFFTDNISQTVVELQERGVIFDDNITNMGFGLVIHLTMPGNIRVQLYQPLYSKK
jgi:hypothetical protein